MTLDTNHSAPDGRRDQKTRPENRGTQVLNEKLDRLMAKTKPSKRELTQQCFRDLYPKLEAYLAQGKPQKDVLAAFNELTQAKVCARTFGDMLKEERTRRDESGDLVCCSTCGKPLSPNMPTGAGADLDTSTNSNSEE